MFPTLTVSGQRQCHTAEHRGPQTLLCHRCGWNMVSPSTVCRTTVHSLYHFHSRLYRIREDAVQHWYCDRARPAFLPSLAFLRHHDFLLDLVFT